MADCNSELGDRALKWSWSEWIPYSYLGPDGEPAGFDIMLIKAILDRAGCPYRLVVMPPKRAQLGIKDGSIDVMGAASLTPERFAYSHFSLPYRDESIVLFARADQSSEFADLTLQEALRRHLRVVAGLGGWYGKEYEANQKALQDAGLLALNSKLDSRILMLMNGRADVLIEDQVAGIATARDLGVSKKLAILPKAQNSDPVHLMLSRVSVPPSVVARIDAAIQSLSNSADYQMVIASYTKLPPQ